MSYHVNPSTLLFDDLTDDQADELYHQMKLLVLEGKQCPWGTDPFEAWCAVAGYDPTQSLLVMATAYPQRVLLSLLERKK